MYQFRVAMLLFQVRVCARMVGLTSELGSDQFLKIIVVS